LIYNVYMNKVLTSIRISLTAKKLLVALANKLGISQSAVIEIAVRDKAKAEGVEVEGE
jgi:hypothetical protein